MRVELAEGSYAVLYHPNAIPRGNVKRYRSAFMQSSAAGAEAALIDDDGPDGGLGTALDEPGEATGEETAAKDKKITREQVEQMKAMVSSGALDALDGLRDHLMLAVVKEWSFGPIDMATLDAVPAGDYETIEDHYQAAEYQRVLNPDFSPSAEPDSPTKPSEP